MKVLNTIKKVFGYILAAVFYAYVIALTLLLLNYNEYGVTEINGTSLIIIREEISTDKYEKGDLVFVESKRINKLKEGDEVFVYKIDGEGLAYIEYGKIGQIYEQDDAVSFENGETYSSEFIIGIGNKKYSDVGLVLSFLTSKWGFLFTVLLPSFIFFVYQVYVLVIEIKYGEDEEEK